MSVHFVTLWPQVNIEELLPLSLLTFTKFVFGSYLEDTLAFKKKILLKKSFGHRNWYVWRLYGLKPIRFSANGSNAQFSTILRYII